MHWLTVIARSAFLFLPTVWIRAPACVFPMQFGGHHRLEDYARRGQEPKDEVQMYTWPDASLRELTDLVKEVQPAARRSTARLEFALVYPDKRGRNVMRVVGQAPSFPYFV